MGKFKGIVYLTEEQYAEMYNAGTLDEDTQYVTDQDPVYSTYEVDAIAKSLQDQITSSAGGEFTKVTVGGEYQPTFNADTKANQTYVDTINQIATKNRTDIADISGQITGISNGFNVVDSRINTVEAKIPAQASSTNQLADKDFVNSSISTATATFRGTVNSVAELPTTGIDINDYAFVNTKDSAGNTVYKRYKYDGSAWVFEYDLNNSSFTAAQWATINSGLTAELLAETFKYYVKKDFGKNSKFYDTGVPGLPVTYGWVSHDLPDNEGSGNMIVGYYDTDADGAMSDVAALLATKNSVLLTNVSMSNGYGNTVALAENAIVLSNETEDGSSSVVMLSPETGFTYNGSKVLTEESATDTSNFVQKSGDTMTGTLVVNATSSTTPDEYFPIEVFATDYLFDEEAIIAGNSVTKTVPGVKAGVKTYFSCKYFGGAWDADVLPVDVELPYTVRYYDYDYDNKYTTILINAPTEDNKITFTNTGEYSIGTADVGIVVSGVVIKQAAKQDIVTNSISSNTAIASELIATNIKTPGVLTAQSVSVTGSIIVPDVTIS